MCAPSDCVHDEESSSFSHLLNEYFCIIGKKLTVYNIEMAVKAAKDIDFIRGRRWSIWRQMEKKKIETKIMLL